MHQSIQKERLAQKLYSVAYITIILPLRRRPNIIYVYCYSGNRTTCSKIYLLVSLLIKQYFFFLQIKTDNPLKNNSEFCVKRSYIKHRLIQKNSKGLFSKYPWK